MNTIDQEVEEYVSPQHNMQTSTDSLFSFVPQAANRMRFASGSINELGIYLAEADADPN